MKAQATKWHRQSSSHRNDRIGDRELVSWHGIGNAGHAMITIYDDVSGTKIKVELSAETVDSIVRLRELSAK